MPTTTRRRQPWFLGSPVRRLRLASGLVLFTYVLLHLTNHALLNISVSAADRALLLQKFIWQGLAGSVLLYGALAVHAALGLWSLYARRTATRRSGELWQLALGLSIPAMLANHVAVARASWSLYGLNKGYIAELYALWIAGPAWGWLQMGVIVVAWTHACLGLFFLLKLRRWWPGWRAPLLAGAILLPVLALLGFTEGGREVTRLLATPAAFNSTLPVSVTGSVLQKSTLAWSRNVFLASWLLAIVLVFLARFVRMVVESRSPKIFVQYPGFGRLAAPRGLSVLDISRRFRVPHASVCGGKGRCSTCRVRVLATSEELPPASPHERAVLLGIGADPQIIRLACQLIPAGDLTVAPLIPPEIGREFIAGREPRMPGDERFVVAMFIDLRGSTGLAERRIPFDSVFLLGRFITAATRAVVACGGRPVQFLGDGLLALFGLETSPRDGCLQALRAVRAASAEFASLAPIFGQEAGVALRYGIGLHCGPAIVGEIGFGDHVVFTALGETINLAHRLQELARTHDVAAAVSQAVFAIAGEDDSNLAGLTTSLRGTTTPLPVRLLPGGWR